MATSNPYEAPRAESQAIGPDGGVSDYRGERRAVILCFFLTVVTLGYYPAIWLLRRRAFLNGLNATKKLSNGYAIAAIVLNLLGLALSMTGTEGANFGRLAAGIGGIAQVLGCFRVASILTSDFARTGRFLAASYLGTFFFSVFYLQYKINRAADVPARVRPAT